MFGNGQCSPSQTPPSQTPLADAAMQQALNSPMIQQFFAQMSGVMENQLNKICDSRLGRAASSAGGPVGNSPGGDPCCNSCALGKPCESTCPGTPPAFSLPECYVECDSMSKCLYRFFEDARLRTDMGAWIEYNKKDIPLVHLNTNVGNAPNYNPVLPPLVANNNYMLMQEASQFLPYEPGFFKVDLTWAGGPPAAQSITINIYTGDYSVQSVTTTPEAAGLVQIGRSFTLQDFISSPPDSGGGCCWFLPYPKIFGCKESAIPNQRRVFIEVRVGAIAPTQLQQFSIVLVKRHTDRFRDYCTQYKLPWK